MAAEPEFFKGAKGLNNKVDPSRITEGELATAYSVDIDNAGVVARRKSFVASTPLVNAKDFYYTGEYGLVVADGNLYLVRENLSIKHIAAGLSVNSRMRYDTVNNITYFVNGFQTGKIFEGAASNWVAADYVGPVTYKRFDDPPAGHLIRYFSSRMYIGEGSTLWYSEPFSYGQFDTARGYVLFDSRLRMISAVKNGLYVSTERCVYFLNGLNPAEFNIVKVHDYPVIEGTDIIVAGGNVLNGEDSSPVSVWTSTGAVCLGLSGGKVVELTGNTVEYPTGFYGSAAFIDGSYVVLIEE
jgi:hypothetical protein